MDLLAYLKGRFESPPMEASWKMILICLAGKQMIEVSKITQGMWKNSRIYFLLHFTARWQPAFVFLTLVSRHFLPLFPPSLGVFEVYSLGYLDNVNVSPFRRKESAILLINPLLWQKGASFKLTRNFSLSWLLTLSYEKTFYNTCLKYGIRKLLK